MTEPTFRAPAAAVARTSTATLMPTVTSTSSSSSSSTSVFASGRASKSRLRRSHSSPVLDCGDADGDRPGAGDWCPRDNGADADNAGQPGATNRASAQGCGAINNNDLASVVHSPAHGGRHHISTNVVVKEEPQQQQQQQQSSPQDIGCAHYKRHAMFVTPCCNKFYKCRFCHDENETHHFDRKTLTELICTECNTRQKVQERCEACGVRFGKYTCLICNLFDDAEKKQYHCKKCGICRIGGSENFFHCEVCDMCLPLQLKIDGHRCVENVSRSHCPVCLGDIHTSRIPCHIPRCGHLLHQMCFDQLLASGLYTCPTCQTSLIDMTALWEYLDEQSERIPIPKMRENQRIHIFCNDCHKTSKTKFHFIGLKCMNCGAYNTTHDIKRRMSLVPDEPTSA